MAPEAEVVTEAAKDRQEALSGINRRKALHPPLSVSGWPMRLLRTVVQPGARTNLKMFYWFRQLVGDGHAVEQ